MTPFALMLRIAGLSQREAASFLSVSPSTVDKWSRGVMTAKERVLDELRGLYAKQVEAADNALDLIETGEPEEVELGYPADDREAQSLGWPSVGAWAGMAAILVAGSPVPVRLVPRGSTPASAAAADAHGI